MEKYNKYYQKTRKERIEILDISDDSKLKLLDNISLTNEVADNIIENQISMLQVPYGLATNFLINNKNYVIPMATEEPSVIAAASNAAKIIRENGGIEAICINREMIGQIAFYENENDINLIIEHKEKILQIANNSHDGIVKIGGGARDIKVENKGKFNIVYLYVDTKDAMGANIVNTMLESISLYIENLIKAKRLMAIISNYASNCISRAKCKLKIEKEIAKKIVMACEFANVDIYRAVTNNKGILNGISALALALSNDTRAIEASAHSYACKNGQYSSLTKWYIEGEYLVGELELSMPIATVGGTLKLNEVSNISMEILGYPDAKELSMIAVSLGLAQNFAALKALVTTGIQKGHMKLHANSIAAFLGATKKEKDILIAKMIENSKIEIEEAKKILESLRK